MTWPRLRFWAGVISLLAAAATIALAATSLAAEANPALHQGEAMLITAVNLLLLPPAAYLVAWLWPVNRVLAAVGGACGIASLLLWAGAPAFSLWSLEALWIGLSAIWWLVTGSLLLNARRRFGLFTVLLGVAAGLDAIITAIPGVQFLAFAHPGAWKLPLSLVWVCWLAIELLRPAHRPNPGARGVY